MEPFLETKKSINCAGRMVDLSTPKVMGIINVTPDSFFAESRHPKNTSSILFTAEKMMIDGATFIDIGGYSTKPNACDVSEEEELSRVLPIVQLLAKKIPEAIISVDTFRSRIAQKAVNEGAALINDISGGQLDASMFETARSLQVPYILMHSRGTPQTMMNLTHYEQVVKDIVDFFHQKINSLVGINDIIIDPGFGFAKNITQNFELLRNLEYLKIFNRPILVGLSRKSMIYKTIHTTPENALNGTTVLHTVALQKGANILRVHDVKEAMEVISLTQSIYPQL